MPLPALAEDLLAVLCRSNFASRSSNPLDRAGRALGEAARTRTASATTSSAAGRYGQLWRDIQR
jgi:hypothetical protein